jgi:hypothetical protein
MQIIFQTFYDNHLRLFIDGFFWIDLCVICIFVLLLYVSIIHQAKKITAKNILYNENLLKFRTEVYHFYEKNFFI